MTCNDFGGRDEAEGLTGIHPRIHSTATPDEVIHVQTEALQLSEIDEEAVLEGETFDGTVIQGSDSIRIIP